MKIVGFSAVSLASDTSSPGAGNVISITETSRPRYDTPGLVRLDLGIRGELADDRLRLVGADDVIPRDDRRLTASPRPCARCSARRCRSMRMTRRVRASRCATDTRRDRRGRSDSAVL